MIKQESLLNKLPLWDSLKFKVLLSIVASILISSPISGFINQAVVSMNLFSGNVGVYITTVINLIVVSAILMFLLNKLVLNPLSIINEALKRLADGNFKDTLNINSKDEVGQLAQSLKDTQEKIRELINEIMTNAELIASHSQELAASAEEVSGAVQEVAGTTNKVATMAEKTVENANYTASEFQKVVETAEESGETIKQTINKINAIAESTTGANKSVRDLGEMSQRVGQITDTITGIAEQTNLLALNAAIESARAGEHGKGFAVVAEEVRKLAEQSSDAAKEIGQLVSHIRQGVDNTVESMGQGAIEVQEGVNLASGAGTALESIIRAITNNLELINEIDRSAKQSNGGTQQLSASNEQVSSTIEQVASATQELANIANRLQLSVSYFKI